MFDLQVLASFRHYKNFLEEFLKNHCVEIFSKFQKFHVLILSGKQHTNASKFGFKVLLFNPHLSTSYKFKFDFFITLNENDCASNFDSAVFVETLKHPSRLVSQALLHLTEESFKELNVNGTESPQLSLATLWCGMNPSTC